MGVTHMESIERDPCLCGCKEIPAKEDSLYLPGHDAKHVKVLAEAYEDAYRQGAMGAANREALIRHAQDVLRPALFRQLWKRLFF